MQNESGTDQPLHLQPVIALKCAYPPSPFFGSSNTSCASRNTPMTPRRLAPLTEDQWDGVFEVLSGSAVGSHANDSAWEWLRSQGHVMAMSTFYKELRIERETRRLQTEEELSATPAVPKADAVPLDASFVHGAVPHADPLHNCRRGQRPRRN